MYLELHKDIILHCIRMGNVYLKDQNLTIMGTSRSGQERKRILLILSNSSLLVMYYCQDPKYDM